MSFNKMTDVEHVRSKTEMYAGSRASLSKTSLAYNFETKKIELISLMTSPYKMQLVKEILANIGDVILSLNLAASPVEIVTSGPYISITNYGAAFDLVYVDKFKEWSHELCFCNVRAGTNVDTSKLNFGAGRNGYGAKIMTFTAANANVDLCTGTKRGQLRFYKGTYTSDVRDMSCQVYSRFSWELDPAFVDETNYTVDEVAVIIRMCIDYTLRDRTSSPIKVYLPPPPKNFDEFMQFVEKRNYKEVANIPAMTAEEYMLRTIGIGASKKVVGTAKNTHASFRATDKFLEFKVNHSFSPAMKNTPQAHAELSKPPFSHPIVHGFLTDNPEGVVHAIVNGIECNGGIHTRLINDILGMLFPEITKDILKANTSAFLVVNGYEPKQANQTKDDLSEINGMKSIPMRIDLPKDFTKFFERWRVWEVARAEMRTKNMSKKISEFNMRRNTKAISVRSKKPDTILLICEGVSARSYADKMRSTTFNGTKRVGVLPLQGKPENVTNVDKELKNKSILAIITEMGLDMNKTYATDTEFDTLNYKKLYILTDPDPDGSHIKGLVMSIFMMYWPCLLMRKEFMFWLKIPLVRVNYKGTTFCYYSSSQVQKENIDYTAQSQISVKYYKGLATSEDCDIQDDFMYAPNVYIQFSEIEIVVLRLLFSKEYSLFRKNVIIHSNHINKNQADAILGRSLTFQQKLEQAQLAHAPLEYFRDDVKKFLKNIIREELKHSSFEAESDIVDAGMLTAFEKTKEELTNVYRNLAKSYLKNTDDEKPDETFTVDFKGTEIFGQWNRTTNKELCKTYLTCGVVEKCDIYDYIVDEYSEFGNLSVLRAIPDLADGLKDVQRKIVYQAMYTNKIVKAQKVSTFSSSVSEALEYHHGSQSMEAAVTHLMLDHQCTQHVPYLEGVGQYGTRSNIPGFPRYIYTKQSQLVKSLLIEDAEQVIPRKNIDGTICELEFIPFKLPMSIINGFRGIGTGWSSDVLPHHPADVLSQIRKILRKMDVTEITPKWKGWNGTTYRVGESWLLLGAATQSGNTVTVTCVPPSIIMYDKYIEKIIEKYGDTVKRYDRQTKGDECLIIFEFTGTVPREEKIPEKYKQYATAHDFGLLYAFELVNVFSEKNMHYYYTQRAQPYLFKTVNHYLRKFVDDIVKVYGDVLTYRKTIIAKKIKHHQDVISYIEKNPDVKMMTDRDWETFLDTNNILFENVKDLLDRQKTKNNQVLLTQQITELKDEKKRLDRYTPATLYDEDLSKLVFA